MPNIARELLILGLLRRAPLSAYDVDRAVRGHAPLYRTLKRGNVYYALERLAATRMLLRRDAAARRGPSDTKSMYRLSSEGERRFRTLLETTLLDAQADDPALHVAYVLLGQLARAQARELLTKRRAAVAQHERRLGRLLGDESGRDGSAYIGIRYAYQRARAEERFARDSLTLLDDAKWTPAWSADDGPILDPGRRL
jgi:DNA-binding PadR family transcriptional regulator